MIQQSILLFLFVCPFILQPVSAISCSQQYECQSYSQDYNYVTCASGTCTCKTNQGFIGNATSTNLCRCDSSNSNSIIWQGSEPYCVNLPLATAMQANISYGQSLINKVKKIYLSAIYPQSIAILNFSQNLDDIFNPNVVGRVDPLVYVVGSRVAVEYFYAFAFTTPTFHSPIIQSAIRSVDFLYTMVNLTGPEPKVAIRLNVLYYANVSNVWYPVQNFTNVGSFTFGPDGRVIKFSVVIPIVGWGTDPQLINRTDFDNSLCTDILSICNSTNDPLGYYTSVADCENFLNSDQVRHTTWNSDGVLPITYDSASGDSDVCRRIHSRMALWDPTIHCPHTGKTGGGFCTDSTTDAAWGLNSGGGYYANYYSKNLD